ncbi:helix-turn-helix domain-containing protein [Cytobacillus horneckiae]|uniref:XRE family transcriptional regulator n=1 Tax=Cytobacillus horneckiae TaxID=549687 RepID=A0A2N0ZFC3_9BACI|nr:helix-turn-helix transcriptional regulator [Cytobacillus horneckiae]MEC1155629.1 helix-turn-helix transcriptional regulator [Cytobacillus horneckiae]MED2936948.1 helix-turn-helix transcriptional regulator [Cytobacillus horneckiae]PKG28183.1 XRE family transcriptional regulator [Cytobacillus horneckiae]
MIMLIATQYKRLIKDKGYSQAYSAKEIGISPSTLGAFINGKGSLSKAKQYRLHRLLEIEDEYGNLNIIF